MRDQRRFEGLDIAAVERNMIDRTRAGSTLRDPYAGPAGMDAIALPFGYMDARHFAEIQPMSREAQRGTGADAHPQRFRVEIPRSVEIIRQDQIMFEMGQGHVVAALAPLASVASRAGAVSTKNSANAAAAAAHPACI